MRLERLLDDRRIGIRPRHPCEHADVAPLDEAEPPGPTRDLRELPRQEISSRLAVELRRLGEEKRLAGKVDPVPEDIGGDRHVGRAPPRKRSISSRRELSGIAP